MEPEAISMSSQSKVANETSSLDITHPLLVGRDQHPDCTPEQPGQRIAIAKRDVRSGEIGHRNRAVRQWRAFPLNVGLPHVPKG